MQTCTSANDLTTAKVWAIVNALPHREAILEADAKYWVQEVVAKYGDLAVWHATRAGGFGGSQIGALVRNFNGQRADHEQSAHDIVAGSLLRKLPDEPSGPMRRGVAMEPQHRVWFYEKHMATRDEAGFDLLSASTGQRIWMRYSPDDLVWMPVPGDALARKRVLIDFKAPSQVDAKEAVAFQYVCQLHMGKLVCENNGVNVESMLLSQFNWAEWALKDDDVPYIPELDQAIIDAGDHYWGFVLRGELPPYVRKPRLETEEALTKQLGDPASRLARMKAIAGALNKHIETLDTHVKGALEKYTFGSSKLVLDGITYTASPKFDTELIRAKVPSMVLEQVLAKVPLNGRSTKAYDERALLAKLKELNVDTKQFVLPGNLDGEALYEELLAVGQDADSLMGEQLRATVDNKLTEEATAWVAREFADLINAPANDASVQTNDREGLEMSRCVPRSVAA